MKNSKFIVLFIFSLVFTFSAFAQKGKKEKISFKVYGNCPQCKERIEDACDVKGIKAAEWNVDTKMMQIIYVPEKISLEKVHQLIADCGHDTDLKKAIEVVYQKLPDCCLYREKPNTHHD